MQSVPFLSLAIWTPIVFGVAILRIGSLSASGSVARAGGHDRRSAGDLAAGRQLRGAQHRGSQFTKYKPWLLAFGSAWRMGVDGLSLWLVVLSAFTTLVRS